MTLLTERPATSSSTTEATLKTAAGTSVAGTAVRGGSYVTLPAGSVPAGVEGNYVPSGVRTCPPPPVAAMSQQTALPLLPQASSRAAT